MKSFLIFLLMALLIILLYALCGGGRPLHFDDPPYVSGWRGGGAVNTETVTLALDADGFDKLEAALAAEKYAEWQSLIYGGRFFPVNNGTGVTVLERLPTVSKIRVRRDGREAYVQNRHIVME